MEVVCSESDCTPRWETGSALDGDNTGVSGGGSQIKGEGVGMKTKIVISICTVFMVSYSSFIQLSDSGVSSLNIWI